MILLWMIILFAFVQSNIETIYKCNSNLSCGCSINSTTVSRIINGEMAESGAWGWTVSLAINSRYLCGGSILSHSWIITVAHCMEDVIASDVIVHAGSNIRWSENQTRIASRVVVHPNYNSTTFANDIALIKLASPFEMNDPSIYIICLPSVNLTILANGEWPVANTIVIAVGWGGLSENGSSSSTLQQVTLEVIDYKASICNSSINDPRVQLCASVPGGSKDTCQGDSGGPLMMFSSNDQWILVGLTSYGYGCAQPASSSVYTRVAAYQDWIHSTMSTAYIQTPSIGYMSLIIFFYLSCHI